MEDAIIGFVNDDLLAGEEGTVDAESEFVLDGTVDSLGVTRLVDFLEQRYDVTIPPEDVTIANFRSARTIAAYLQHRVDTESAA